LSRESFGWWLRLPSSQQETPRLKAIGIYTIWVFNCTFVAQLINAPFLNQGG